MARLAVFLTALFVLSLFPAVFPRYVEARVGYDSVFCEKATTKVVVDITTQSLYVYEQGRLIKAVIENISTATSRQKEHRIRGKIIPYQPRGCFIITGKNGRHFSNAYGVWMQHPVWFGGPGIVARAYAFHCVPAGKAHHLGHPDSGGCVRTPNDFCHWFYQWANPRIPVQIYGQWEGPEVRKRRS